MEHWWRNGKLFKRRVGGYEAGRLWGGGGGGGEDGGREERGERGEGGDSFQVET